ncbi:dTDP-glucose 4,6-dehydratase [Nitrosopumilus zosterae]|uniref:dTDP-glucose 4,6-dehydratase n=1 Tax=Nitrosopumilus zosterae TaxID=718286 RepID=A0A2S2KUK7_9ARCH|nr:dTDP-glucose 4,6-dehydratase [Nitrosopumilus zosterae]BDQ31815.1 dTDP-glucose 4,6-dehydratase [Nitrosopumilus zosterae]GBH35165.1 dTDP-glucose 4,6-dehydratase [Nitrosopumilus zosterae]
MKILVCGGAGFIGSAFIRNHFNNHPKDEIINLDSLTIGSNLLNLKQIGQNQNYQFFKEDIKNQEIVNKLANDVDVIVNFAAESHVDRSIANPKPFIETNILGTYSLLEATKKYNKLFIHVSTDEVYGDAEDLDSFTEKSLIKPSNPYSATKASADHLVAAYHRTYNIKCITTRCTNNFGPFQFPEKLIPKTIIRAKKNLKVPLYGDGNQIRSWIYVYDHVQAIDDLILRGVHGQEYNITAWNEISNKIIVEKILKFLGKSDDLIEHVKDRPGHDRRYSIDAAKIQNEIGWKPKHEFEQALNETVEWYEQNQEWWEPLVDDNSLHSQPWTLTCK